MNNDNKLGLADIRYLPENIKRRKIIKYIIAFFLMFAVIYIAYFFPYIVYLYENIRLTNYGIHYKSESLNVEEKETSFVEKLSIMNDLIQRNSYIYIDSQEVENSAVKARMTSEEAVKAGIDGINDAFVSMYAEMTGMEAEDISSKIFVSNEYFVQPYLMIKPDTKEMFLVWLVEYDEPTGIIEVFIDDETGKILSMVSTSTPFSDSLMGVMVSGYSKELTEGLSKYYDMNMVCNKYNTYSISGRLVIICDIYITDVPGTCIELRYSEDPILRCEIDYNFPYSITGNDVMLDENVGGTDDYSIDSEDATDDSGVNTIDNSNDQNNNQNNNQNYDQNYNQNDSQSYDQDSDYYYEEDEEYIYEDEYDIDDEDTENNLYQQPDESNEQNNDQTIETQSEENQDMNQIIDHNSENTSEQSTDQVIEQNTNQSGDPTTNDEKQTEQKKEDATISSEGTSEENQ
ncbi:MAG: hypothetical protein K6E10_11315 [Eubacterium sp.]|nr:hypothetical protein [Eubacterium sp.]